MPQISGILLADGRGGCVRPNGKSPYAGIYIPEQKLNGAPFGMLVVVEIDPDCPPEKARGAITEVLGDPGRPDVAMTGIIRAYGLEEKFSPNLLSIASKLPLSLTEKVIQAELSNGRKDLRGLRTLTIDGKDAKDLDDAISIMALPDHAFRLWVHIADVSHYVKEDSALDKAARLRGNSTYLSDRVLPMLPPQLSNGICSLNPGQDRLALTVMQDINAAGVTIKGDIFASVIKSDLRADYEDVYAAVYKNQAPDSYRDMFADLKLMRTLADLLRVRRERKGCLDFDFPETKVDLNEDGTVNAIHVYPINEANGMIEEFMISANVFVARRFRELGAPFIYRVHEEPDTEKLQRFVSMAKILGYKIKSSRLSGTAEMAAVLDEVKGEPSGALLSQLLLQSLAKARYDSVCLGHFGLAENDYCHFTSPIRRYPDLFIHRVIKGYLSGVPRSKKWRASAQRVAEHCSDTERASMYAEFDSVDLKVAEFMGAHLGEAYHGRVAGMIPAGMFVQLDNTAEGMLPFRSFREYYAFDERRLEAHAEKSGRVFKIGQEVDVLIARANIETRQVDFVLNDPQASKVDAETIRLSAKRGEDTMAFFGKGGPKGSKARRSGDMSRLKGRAVQGGSQAKGKTHKKAAPLDQSAERSQSKRKKKLSREQMKKAARRKEKEAKRVAQRLKLEKQQHKQRIKAQSLKGQGFGEN